MAGRARATVVAVATIALLATSLWAWSRGLTGPYLFDDQVTPLGDPASQSLTAWTLHAAVTLRPLTKLTYALESETSITNTPAARRVASIVMLSVSASLLLLLIRRLAPRATLVTTTALAALWFLHPVHADCVLLASGRTAVLSGLFVIAALLALGRSKRWLAALFFLLACLSRETALAALLPLAVLAAARHKDSWRLVLRDLTPLIFASAVVVGWMLITPRYVQLVEYSMLGRPVVASAIGQVGAVPVGIGLLFNPAALSIDYGVPLPATLTEPLFLLGVLLYLAAAAGVVVFLRRGSPAVAVGLALWLAALIPTQSIVPKLDALTNRPLSLALAGLLLSSAPVVEAVRRRSPAVIALGASATIIAATMVATARRAELFQSELSLWQDAAAKSLVNERPHAQYAALLRQAGRLREAQQALSVAAQINPFNSQVASMSRAVHSEEVSR